MTERPLVAFYGDDLTGSTDTLSVLAEAGLKALLFVDTPSEHEVQASGALDAIGIAGTARMMTPAEMDEKLPAVFDALERSGVALVHYKTCSTFDSSPTIGSIGHAIALARPRFRAGFVPVVVGQPGIGRYCAFGSLFACATAGGPVYRLDRHPNMARHPTTPMDEADLRVVLNRQGIDRVALLEITHLRAPSAAAELDDLLSDQPDAVLFDVIDDDDLTRVGCLVGARLRADDPVFGVGSSGLEQALLAGWGALTSRAGSRPPRPEPGKEPAFIVSGSRSPVTATQIEVAKAHGFASLPLDTRRFSDRNTAPGAIAEAAAAAASHLTEGRSVIAHSSLGPDDPRGLANADRGSLEQLAKASGALMRAVVERGTVRRLGLCGGDTASLAVRRLGARALTYDCRLAPGVPVCRVWGADTAMDGKLLMLKGGQMGPPDVFARLQSGLAA